MTLGRQEETRIRCDK